jgi:maleylacetate reductase
MPDKMIESSAAPAASPFVHDWPHSRVRFGVGEYRYAVDEAKALGARRLFLIVDPANLAVGEEIGASLGERLAGSTDNVVMHVPAELVSQQIDQVRLASADGLICVGGGSATGLAKGIAKGTGLPIIAVPTTFAGSEMTSIWGITEAAVKSTGRDERVRPKSVIYDPLLTRSLPIPIVVTSMVNALAHAVEALYAPGASALTGMVAAEAITELLSWLPRLAADPDDIDARCGATYGCWLAGWSLNVAAMGLHHKLCHILGGAFDLPHASLHTVMLPYVLAFNALEAPRVVEVVSAALHHAGGAAHVGVADALQQMLAGLGAPVSLSAIGLPDEALPSARRGVTSQLAPLRPLHPRDPTDSDLEALVDHAAAGAPPSSLAPQPSRP